MANQPSDAITRANAAILERMAGAPMTPATPQAIADPMNPNVTTRPCDAVCSAADSNTQSGRAPQRGEPHLRLVWCAPSHG